MVRLNSNFWRPLIVVLCELLAFQSAFGQQGLRIEVVEGAGAKNIAQQISPKPITVRVQDASGRRIGGATVVFTSPQTGPSGEFSNDSRTFETLTDSDGLATAGNYHPNAILGSYQIQARAQVQGQMATALIAQENVAGSKGHGKMIAVLVIAGAAAGAVIASRRTKNSGTTAASSITFPAGGGSSVGAPIP